MNNDLKEIYNRFAEKYKQNRGLFDMSNIIADFAGRLSRVPGHLLDLGCGAGEPFPAYFIEQGWQVTGVDFSSRMLEMAHLYQPGMETILSDICEVDFPDEQFDAVTAIYCLFHIEYTKHADIFRKVPIPLISPPDSEGIRHAIPMDVASLIRIMSPPL